MVRKNTYYGIFFIALATLLWEILLTRIFSATMYYHFAFLSISMAMLGFGCSGTLVYIFPKMFVAKNCDRQLTLFASLFSISMCLAIVIFLQLNLDLQVSLKSFLRLCMLLPVVFVPYFFSGLTITLALKHYSRHITVLYCFDLVGAGIGCMLAIVLLFIYDGISLVLLACAVAGLAAVFFSRGCITGVPKKLVYMLAFAMFSMFLVNAYGYRFLKVTSVRGESQADIIYEKWNPINRVTARLDKAAGLDAIKIDYDAVDQSHMYAFDGNIDKVKPSMNGYIKSFFYQIREKADILIIGLGGGQDVLAAHVNGHTNITAVEINPAIADMNKRLYRDFNNNLFGTPGIRLFVDDGRNYVRNTKDKYDIIQLGNVTSGAGSASGAFTFVENTLYTVEAFKDYASHLKENGVLWVTQLRLGSTPDVYLTVFRVVAGIVRALEELGIARPENNIIVIQQKDGHMLPYACVFMKMTPFQEAEIKRIDELVRAMDLEYACHPDFPVKPNALSRYLHAHDRHEFIENYPFNVIANTDDSPFFFNFLKPRHYLGKLPALNPFLAYPAFMFRALFIIVFILTAATIVLPLLLVGKQTASSLPTGARLRFIAYFACLGLGFMLVEIPLIQKFILFLGQPMYAMATTLTSLLIFSGLGSLTAGRFSDRHLARTLLVVIMVICLFVLLYTGMLPFIFESLLGARLWLRLLLSVALLFPLGMALGMAFPLGIRQLEKDQPAMIPWVWGINGACSVLGSIAAWGASLNFGYTTTLYCGLIVYGIAGLALLKQARFCAASANCTS